MVFTPDRKSRHCRTMSVGIAVPASSTERGPSASEAGPIPPVMPLPACTGCASLDSTSRATSSSTVASRSAEQVSRTSRGYSFHPMPTPCHCNGWPMGCPMTHIHRWVVSSSTSRMAPLRTVSKKPSATRLHFL